LYINILLFFKREKRGALRVIVVPLNRLKEDPVDGSRTRWEQLWEEEEKGSFYPEGRRRKSPPC